VPWNRLIRYSGNIDPKEKNVEDSEELSFASILSNDKSDRRKIVQKVFINRKQPGKCFVDERVLLL
jgi:hypothetical protein